MECPGGQPGRGFCRSLMRIPIPKSTLRATTQPWRNESIAKVENGCGEGDKTGYNDEANYDGGGHGDLL